MVGQKHQRKVFVFCRQSVYNRPDYVFINHFDAVNLAFGISAVSAFVGCFHVDIAEIVCFKGFESGFSLARKVSVPVACRTVYFDNVHACAFADTFQQIDRRNHCAAKGSFVDERGERGLHAAAPEPDAVGGIFAFFFTLFVYRVVFKQRIGFFVKVKEQILVNAFREIVLDFPARYVVRRGNFVVHDAVVYNQAMAITDARIKMQGVRFQMFFDMRDKHGGFRRRYFARGIVDHRFVRKVFFRGERDKIHSVRDVGIFHIDAYAERFQR